MKHLLLTLLLFFIICFSALAQKEEEKTWSYQEMDSAVAVLYNVKGWDKKFGDSLVLKGKLNPTAFITRKLSQKQLIRAVNIINGNYEYKPIYYSDDSFCGYEPRHGVVFYKNGQITHYVELCYACSEWRVRPSTSFKNDLIRRLALLFKYLNIPIYNDERKYAELALDKN